MEENNKAQNEQEQAQNEQNDQIQQEHMNMAMKMAEDLRKDLLNSFKKLAEKNETTEDKIQLGLRFHDLEEGEGKMYYQLMVGWKPLREANFNRDFLGIEGKAAMFPDDTGKEAFINIYVLGYAPLKIKGIFSTLAEKYKIQKWSELCGIFYKKDVDSPIKLGIFVVMEGKMKKVETIDIFNQDSEVAPEGEKQVEPVTSEKVVEVEPAVSSVEPTDEKPTDESVNKG